MESGTASLLPSSGRRAGLRTRRAMPAVAAMGRAEPGWRLAALLLGVAAGLALTGWPAGAQGAHLRMQSVVRKFVEQTGCQVVGLRTDSFNFASQRAIEALGVRKDGVIRHHAARRDGSARDTVIYSVLATEWPDVKRHLEHRLARHGAAREGA